MPSPHNSFKSLCFLCLVGLFPAGLYAQSNAQKPDQVWDVDIQGNTSFSSVLIKDQIATEGYSFFAKLKFWDRSGHPLNKIEVKKDVIRIQNFYHRRGFPHTKARYRIEDGNKSWKKEVTFIITEKAPIRIRDLSYDFSNEEQYRQEVLKSDKFSKVKRKSDFKVGSRYAIIKKPEIIGNYENALKNMGFAYAEVQIQAKVDTARLAADLTVNSSLGPRTYIDSVSVKGDSTVSDHYVIKEAGFKQGEQFSLDALQEAQRQIFNHHLFRFATINIPDQPKDSTLNLEMRVRENPLRTVKASAGFGTEEYLRGKVSWTHHNAFGHAHKFTAVGKASFIDQSVNLDYLFPYVFNTKSSFVISPFAEHLLEPSYELFRLGITNSFIYRYSRQITASASYQYTKNAELSQQLNESLPDTTKNYDLSSLQFSGYYNQGFDRRIERGWVVQPYFEISGFVGSSTYQFQKLSVDVRRYTPLTPSTTLATRVQLGKIFATQEDSLPNNVRDYLGGTNSVRGWRREQLGPKRVVVDSVRDDQGNVIADSTQFDRYIAVGGRSYFGFNLEIRQDVNKLIKGFGINAFLDGGQVWRKDPDFMKRPLQFSVGGGVRYKSPIGPVRLDVGYKINPSDADLNIYRGVDHGSFWDRIGIHVSIGQAF